MQQKPLQLCAYICFDKVVHSCCKNISVYLLLFWLRLPHVSTIETLRNT